MSTTIETVRITPDLHLLDEDPAGDAARLGLPVDPSDLIDTELLYNENSITIVVIVY